MSWLLSKKTLPLLLILIIIGVAGVYSAMNVPESEVPEETEKNRVLLKTSLGDILIQLFDDMPITTGNFKNLVEQGTYDGTIFHRVVVNFVVQGGDPTGTGTGDPTIPTIPDEFTDHNYNKRSTVAMANSGPNTGKSQFFINLKDNLELDTLHPVFGRVIGGMDVVDAIGQVETAAQRPIVDVVLIQAKLVE